MPGGTPYLGQDYVMPRATPYLDESARRPFKPVPPDNLEITPDDVEGLGRATDDFWPGIERDQTEFPGGQKLNIRTAPARRHIHIISRCIVT